MDQHLGHAERVGDEAGVLAAGAAEAVQRIAGHVVAALHRNLLDRVRHVLDRDLDEAVGDLLGRFAADLFGESGEGFLHGGSASSGWFWSGPKIFGKKSGMSLPTITLASVTASGPPRR